MTVRIAGDSGRSRIDMEVRMAVGVFVDLLVCHCFIKLVEFGGSVIVE